MMKEIIQCAGRDNVKEVIIGMAHRGRLNVLVNVLGKEPNALFKNLKEKLNRNEQVM